MYVQKMEKNNGSWQKWFLTTLTTTDTLWMTLMRRVIMRGGEGEEEEMDTVRWKE